MDSAEIVKVWGVNGGTFGVVTFTELETGLKLTLLILSIVYTIMKIRILKNDKDKK